MNKKSDKFITAFKHHQSGELDLAQSLYMEILAEESNNDEVWDLLGILNHQKNNFQEAELCIKKAISLNPQIYYAENLARLYLDMGHFDISIEIYKNLVKIAPSYDNYFNIAMAYKNLHDWNDAKENYFKALELNPNGYEVHYNLAYISLNENNPREAVEHYKNALAIKPDDWESMYFLGLAYMQAMDYKKGLKAYEARLCRKSAIVSQQKIFPNLIASKPIWNGESLKDKVIYVYYEAGFGDVLMFYRYIPQLVKMAKKVIFKPQRELVPLFRENSYGIEIIDLYCEEKDLNFDYHLPILSLPYVLGYGTDEVFVNHDIKYLKATNDKIQLYKEKYCKNNKFKIGIKWQGNAHYDKERILKVEDFFRLFEIENTQFYSFQTLEGSEEFEKFRGKYNVIDLGSTFNNFLDTAGAIENMDLIIANDTSLVHLAGAMQKQCWVLLPYIYNWRWHTDLSKCDWYDTVKIYRQPTFGDWNSVFEKLKKDLSLLAN